MGDRDWMDGKQLVNRDFSRRTRPYTVGGRFRGAEWAKKNRDSRAPEQQRQEENGDAAGEPSRTVETDNETAPEFEKFSFL
jgi:hypothetical protein